MAKFLIFLIGLVVVAIVIMGIMNTAQVSSNNEATMSAQETERVRIIEQTKQDAALLRAEESSRTLNTVALIMAPIILIGMIVFVLIVADSKITRNRIYELDRLARIERGRIREEQRLQIIEQQRLRLEQQHYLLLQNKSYIEGEVIEREI